VHCSAVYTNSNINCPVCGMAIEKVSDAQKKHIEKMIEESRKNLPMEVKNKKVNILCN
jgi:uncharacterized Zn finger protein (UPF0148 family)